MELARRRHNQGLSRMHDDFYDVFDRFFRDWGLMPQGETAWTPAIDIAEREDAIVVTAELPGMKADDIDISVQDNTLSISGEKKEEKEETGENSYHVERRYGAFRRTLTLPNNIDAEKIDAKHADGVLTVTLPKTEKAKPKRIDVKT